MVFFVEELFNERFRKNNHKCREKLSQFEVWQSLPPSKYVLYECIKYIYRRLTKLPSKTGPVTSTVMYWAPISPLCPQIWRCMVEGDMESQILSWERLPYPSHPRVLPPAPHLPTVAWLIKVLHTVKPLLTTSFNFLYKQVIHRGKRHFKHINLMYIIYIPQ